MCGLFRLQTHIENKKVKGKAILATGCGGP
jgi:hypothetical protein